MSHPLSQRADAPASAAGPLSQWRRVVLIALVAYGALVRAWDLGAKPFRLDEAESSINALTILQHGVPVDHYLGQPIFENTLTRPWPESAEYEFQDSSYSDRGLAVYHGWAPLYVLAATFAAAGILPDEETPARAVRHAADEIRRRTVAGRIPGVFFGAVFLLALFAAARTWYGTDAAWAALTAGVVCEPAIYFARQARYYSATLAAAACCGLLLGRMVFRGGWRDFLLGAAALVLLFHTHLLSFLAALAAGALTLPWLWRHPRAGAKLTAAAAILAAGVIPWVVLTGFLGSTSDIPSARSLLSTADLTTFLSMLGLFPLLAALTLAWLLVAARLWGLLPARLAAPFADRSGAFLWLAAWGLLGAAAFWFLMPAPSFFFGRLVLTILVPGLLFGALFVTAAARVLFPRHPTVPACALLVLILFQAGQATFWGSKDPGTPFRYDLIESLRDLDLSPGARLFSSPNYHLTFTFYTGMPVQSAAPVRKAFFDQYPGELLIVEAGPRYEPLTPEEIRDALQSAGQPPSSEADVAFWECLLDRRLVREDLQGRVARITPPLEPAPLFMETLLGRQRVRTEEAVREAAVRLGNPMLKGLPLPDYLTCWQIFYYRFVNPEARVGRNLNYADRIRGAEAVVLPGEWVFYRCPARRDGAVRPP